MMLDKAGIKYTVIDATSDKDMAKEFGVLKAPTMFVPTKDGYAKYDNASEIKRSIEEQK